MYGLLLLLASGTVADAPQEPTLPNVGRDVVLQWNEAALKLIRAERTPPPVAARNLAIMHAAIYDAVNAVHRTHRPYRFRGEAAPGSSPEVAASLAAHRALVNLYPKQVAFLDAMLDETVAGVPDGESKTSGMMLGKAVSEDLLDVRRQDGVARRVAYKPSTAIGLWRPTPPLFHEALLPQWPYLTCFCMKAGSQFRPAAPPALTSNDYAASFREVKMLGGLRSAARTPEQTQIARFWADDEGTVTPPGHWNRIAQTVAVERRTTLAENARLFALLNLALADAGIACWDCKYAFNVWRPIDGIREADPARHRDTTPDPDWTPLLTTPPFPTYTSGHSTFSGAAAAVLASFFGTDDVAFTSTGDSLPGVKRTFVRFSAAAQEAGKSRIYGGIHWEFDNREGLTCGREVGEYVVRNFLRPN
jgi:hypothetical protein